MCIKCQFHWTCILSSTHILNIFREIYLDLFQKEIPNSNIPKFVLKWDYTNTKYYQIYRGVSDTNTNSTKYTLETPNNPKYKFFMVIWRTKCYSLAMIRLCYQHLKWNQCRAHQVCIYKYAWNQIIPTWIEFIPSWNEFIPSISNSLPGFNKNKSRAALGAFIRKILFGTSSIYYFWFLEKFLIFNSAKLQFIQEWIHSRMESIHTN